VGNLQQLLGAAGAAAGGVGQAAVAEHPGPKLGRVTLADLPDLLRQPSAE
jgi:hypothetical protein